MQFLKTFGQIGFVSNHDGIKGKLSDHAWKGIFVGYPKDHSGDCYQMYNPVTRKVVLSRDVCWSEELYSGKNPKVSSMVVTDDGSDDEDDFPLLVPNLEGQPTPDQEGNPQPQGQQEAPTHVLHPRIGTLHEGLQDRQVRFNLEQVQVALESETEDPMKVDLALMAVT